MRGHRKALSSLVTAGLLSVAAFGAGAAEGSKAASNFDAADYFSGKTIRILVGFSAGGGTDLQARLFADHWGKFLPGRPRFVVANVKPNTASANRLYRSPPDGTTMELTASSNVAKQFTSPQAKFKIEENRIVGSHTGSSSVMLAYKDLPYRTVRDAIGGKAPIRVNQRGPSEGGAMRLAAMSEWLDVPVKFITGARGTADKLLDMERGNTDAHLAGGGGTVWFSLPFIRPGWMQDGMVRPFVLMGPSDIEVGANNEIGMPADVPYVTDLLTDPKRKKLYEAFANIDSRYSKIFMLPPGTPDPIVDAFRQSYQAMLADAAFRAKLEKLMGEPVTFTSGQEIEPRLDQMVKDYAENADEFARWISWAKERF
jgi:tripartite-type tricarboxylate transporter receptor subunit TctC